jgi:hypothetical protein
MVWDDDTPRKLISEDGFNLVASFPGFTSQRGTVCFLSSNPNHTDDVNSRHISQIASSNTALMFTPIRESRRPVPTKQAHISIYLGKCLEKSDWSKDGLALDKRCIYNYSTSIFF